MKFVVGKNGSNPVKNLPRPRFVHRETHMEGPRRELGTPAVEGESLTACATRPPYQKNKYLNYLHYPHSLVLQQIYNLLCFADIKFGMVCLADNLSNVETEKYFAALKEKYFKIFFYFQQLVQLIKIIYNYWASLVNPLAIGHHWPVKKGTDPIFLILGDLEYFSLLRGVQCNLRRNRNFEERQNDLECRDNKSIVHFFTKSGGCKISQIQ